MRELRDRQQLCVCYRNLLCNRDSWVCRSLDLLCFTLIKKQFFCFFQGDSGVYRSKLSSSSSTSGYARSSSAGSSYSNYRHSYAGVGSLKYSSCKIFHFFYTNIEINVSFVEFFYECTWGLACVSRMVSLSLIRWALNFQGQSTLDLIYFVQNSFVVH